MCCQDFYHRRTNRILMWLGAALTWTETMQTAWMIAGDTNSMSIVRAGMENRTLTATDLAVTAKHTVTAYVSSVFPTGNFVQRDKLIECFNFDGSIHGIAELQKNSMLL
mmetsp:Transcript_28063/g.47203  ORF Transcript_28063/g.47203 Transcript_28063/m.47203 type:complete len:109 (+) Transcript_28063:3091-3417(+)